MILVATQNAHKALEIGQILGIEVTTLAAHPGVSMPEETGETFEDNARLKAEHVARALGLAVLADDSGLEVDALDGAPGVRSARYAPGSDADRVAKLLAALAGVPPERRGARFVCAMAYARPGQPTVLVRGAVEGRIAGAPRGAGGFGYDPVFLVEELPGGRTMAELSADEKNAVSHRGRALARLRPHFSLEQSRRTP